MFTISDRLFSIIFLSPLKMASFSAKHRLHLLPPHLYDGAVETMDHFIDGSTQLEVWRAKDNCVEPSIKWSIVSTAPSYKCGGSRCNLCLAEKLAILSGDRKMMLNKRSEIVNTCRHRKKFKLKSIRLDGSL